MESDSMLTLVGSILSPHSAAYVSGPLDTGLNYFVLKAPRTPESVRKENQAAMRDFVDSLRGRLSYPVIDPGLLRVRDWSGPQYAAFFCDVIERYVRELWFMDGWQFSRGATKEFQFGHARGISCLNASGIALNASEGRALISAAADRVDALGLDGEVLRRHLP